MRELGDAPFLDMFDETFRADPGPVVEELRRESWVVRTAMGCLVIGRDQVHTLLSDPRLTTSLLHIVRLQGVTEGRLHDLVASSLLAVDGEDHARLRRLVSRSFTPRAADRHRPVMRQLVDELVDGFAAAGRCEFMADFADHYPVEVICHLLGVPREDHDKFARWGDSLTHVLSLELSLHLEEINQAMAGLEDYIDYLVRARQADPEDDLLTQLVNASDSGDHLSELELHSLIAGLLFAGYDTTRNQLALAMWLFCDHADQWRMLAERPSLAVSAVEEIMRFAGAVSVTPRIALSDVELDGWKIPAGTLTSLSLASANHDPAAYEEPERFDITARREASLTFGGGPHYCLGANLARAEMQEALPILARRLRDLELAEEPQWRSLTGIFGPTSLRLRFDTATSSSRTSRT